MPIESSMWLFSWFAIFFFSVIYGEINAKYRYFKGYDSGIKPVEEVEFIRQEKVLFPVNGLYVYPIRVRFLIGINQTEKMIYSLDQLDCVEGDKFTIETYQRILIKADKHVWRILRKKKSNPSSNIRGGSISLL